MKREICDQEVRSCVYLVFCIRNSAWEKNVLLYILKNILLILPHKIC